MTATQEDQSRQLTEVLASGDLERLIAIYLSPEHRDNPGSGCTSAALVVERT